MSMMTCPTWTNFNYILIDAAKSNLPLVKPQLHKVKELESSKYFKI
ncbi:13930_t:CDS:1, partial [Acaulospora morrowiae]